MTLKEIYNAIRAKLAELPIQGVPMFTGDTLTQIKQGALNGGCYAVNITSADVSSANASYRIKPQSRDVAVYYACAMETAAQGDHLDDIESIFECLHAFRVGNDTLQPKDFKLLNDDSVLVYALNFSI